MSGDGLRPTVLKVGGSLLDLPDLGERIAAFLRREDLRRPALVAGGGAATDLVRGWDRIHRLGEERSHRLALEAMDLNARLLAGIVPAARIVRDRAGLDAAWAEGAVPVLEVSAFLAEKEQGDGERLPHLWSATSDSVAAFIAAALGADLVLAKSSPPPPGALADLVGLGYVDEHLPRLARGIRRISAVDLRENSVTGNPVTVTVFPGKPGDRP